MKQPALIWKMYDHAENGSLPVLLRALGPLLAAFGIATFLSDRVLEIHNASGTLVVTNDNWKESQQAVIKATGLAPPNDKDSAILMNLMPGMYTAVVRDASGGSGISLFEAYNSDCPALKLSLDKTAGLRIESLGSNTSEVIPIVLCYQRRRI